MTLWAVLTIMTSFAAGILSAPLLWRFGRRLTESTAEVYRGQKEQVEAAAAEDRVDRDQKEAARSATLTAGCAQPTARTPFSPGERNFAVAALAGIAVLGLGILYALTLESSSTPIGGPGPRISDAAGGESAVERLAAATRPQALQNVGAAQPQTGLPPVEEMVQRLAARLQRNPKDLEGWRTLGWSYFNTEHFAEAAAAYGQASALAPKVAELKSARGESLVRFANGRVTAEAASIFDEALKLDPKDARARFFKGLAKEQAGDKSAALDDWIAILNEVDPNESWVPDLRQRVADLGRNLGANTADRLQPPKTSVSGSLLDGLREQENPGVTGAIRGGPSSEDIRNAQAMPPADRAAMIRGMVDGLASRLERSPRDPEGWIKLIQSRTVLGEREAATQSLDRALEVFGDNPQELERITAAARQLGLIR